MIAVVLGDCLNLFVDIAHMYSHVDAADYKPENYFPLKYSYSPRRLGCPANRHSYP